MSPEKTKAESQKKSRRQSSRRRKRSSSRSSEESEELQPEAKSSLQVLAQNSAESTDVKSDSDSKNNDKSVESFITDKKEDIISIDAQKPEETAYVQEHSSLSNKEDNKDFQEWKEDEDMEEKKNKGKSKGKNISNFEKSSHNIEPETENENVQGTHQSPSNDYADNENVVQNVNDTAKFNSEAQEGSKLEDTVTQTEDQQKILEVSFMSEYAQINEPSQDNENITEPDKIGENEHQQKSPDNEKSTTPEPKINKEDISKECSEYKEDDNPKKTSSENEKSGSKKKITLRRSPPENKETATPETSATKIERSISTDENKKTEETKRSKKITLKRHTTDDSTTNTNEVQNDNKNGNISCNLPEEILERRRRLSSFGDDKEQIGEGNICFFIHK